MKTLALPRRICALMAAVLLAFCLAIVCVGQAQARTFVDSLGREVEIPETITAIVPSGHTANQVLLTAAPELMVGLSATPSDTILQYFDPDGELGLADLPVFGAAFGAAGDLNKEAVAAAGAQILIDTGEAKDGLGDDLDELQEQLGIPCVFIETYLEDWGTAYRMLGELLGLEERCEELAQYCDEAYEEISALMEEIPEEERITAAYILGDSGTNAQAKGGYQAGVIDMCANNVVVVENASGSGTGNEISLETLAVWDPELIVFATGSIYDTVAEEPAWAGIAAILTGNYYEAPDSPYNWLSGPPTINQILGMQWFARVCYPDLFEDDLQEVVCGYYSLFYGYDLTDEEYEELTANCRVHLYETDEEETDGEPDGEVFEPMPVEEAA